MIDTRAKFEEALAAFAARGNRWGGSSNLTYWGAAAGLTADEVIDAAHGIGVTTRDADIRRGMLTAAAKVSRFNTGGGSVRRCGRAKPKPQPKQPTDRVRRLIEAGRDVATLEALRELSPVTICHDPDPLARRVQTEMQLVRLFGRGEVVSIRRDKADTMPATPTVNLRPIEDWLAADAFGEVVRPNPFTGKAGRTGEGKPSFGAKDCIAAFRHTVWEFDEMPLADQCRFWAGFIRGGTMPLVSITYSGGKSLHGVVRVDAPDEEAFARHRAAIIERYAADPDRAYRLDAQALNPLTGCRLAGVVRRDTGKVQELLYACRDWFDTDRQRELNPPEDNAQPPPTTRHNPPQHADAPSFAARCAECRAMRDCRQAWGRFWDWKSSNGAGCNAPFAGWTGAKEPPPAPATTTTQKTFTL